MFLCLFDFFQNEMFLAFLNKPECRFKSILSECAVSFNFVAGDQDYQHYSRY